MNDDDQINEPEPGELEEAPNLWEAIQHPRIAKGVENVLGAVTRAIDKWGENEPTRVKAQLQAVWLSYVFGLLIFVGIGFLGWLGILSHETTAAILAALIGYWYGQKEKQKR
jgi:hypothetical protein